MFRAEWLLHQESWKRNEQYLGVHAARGAVERLELAVDVPTTEALVDAFITEGEKAEFEPCPGVVEALRALHGAGVRIGIICDVGFTPSTGLRRLLQRFEVLDVFTGWSFSDEVGWYKPAPQMFQHSLDYLGTTRRRPRTSATSAAPTSPARRPPASSPSATAGSATTPTSSSRRVTS